MVEVIFTVDYEIRGDGEGSLKENVYEPAKKLNAIFCKHKARFVIFIEVAEMEMIEANRADNGIELIIGQLRDLCKEGHEFGLHIHPWWYNARYENGKWLLDYSEYNLCNQPEERINNIVDRAIACIRSLLGSSDFTPLSFRAGHLLFQPTQPLSNVLAGRGIKLDSSVYKGGRWHQHKLDYCRAPKDVNYWSFMEEVATPNPQGALVEIPIYTQMAPLWKLFTAKRVNLQHRGSSASQTGKKMLSRIRDFLRFRYPLKFDLGQMTREEIVRMVDRIVRRDRNDPSTFRPVVAIMHTKDPIDFDAVDSLLAYLDENHIKVSTFAEVYRTIKDIDGSMDRKY